MEISTKKNIEVWDGRDGRHWKFFASDLGDIVMNQWGEDDQINASIRIPVEAVGQICRALHELGQNVIYNTKEDDAD